MRIRHESSKFDACEKCKGIKSFFIFFFNFSQLFDCAIKLRQASLQLCLRLPSHLFSVHSKIEVWLGAIHIARGCHADKTRNNTLNIVKQH